MSMRSDERGAPACIHGSAAFAAAVTMLSLLAGMIISITMASGAPIEKVMEPPRTVEYHDSLSPSINDPDITIHLDQESVAVDVYPSGDGKAVFTGTVYCDWPPGSPPGHEAHVFLTTDAGGWAVSSPPEMVFDRNKEREDFRVQVQVPPEMSHMVQGTLNVGGRYRMLPGVGGGTLETVSGIIYINAFSKMEVGSEKGLVSAPVGEWAEFCIYLLNEGNSGDVVEITVEYPDELDVDQNVQQVTIPEKQKREVTLKARQPSGMGAKHRITLDFKPSHEKSFGNRTFTIYLKTTLSLQGTVLTPLGITISAVIMIAVALAVFLIIRMRMKRTGSGVPRSRNEGPAAQGP